MQKKRNSVIAIITAMVLIFLLTSSAFADSNEFVHSNDNPKGAMQFIRSEENCASLPSVESLSYDDICSMFYQNIDIANPELTNIQKDSLANEISMLIQNAREDALNNTGNIVLNLGKIENGLLVPISAEISSGIQNENSSMLSAASYPYSELMPIIDSKFMVIGHGYLKYPHRTSRVHWMSYTTEWFGVDHYRSSNLAGWIAPNTITVEKVFPKYAGTIYASDIVSQGFYVNTSASTIKQQIEKNYSFSINAWQARYLRPIILWYRDSYAATYEYFYLGIHLTKVYPQCPSR